MTKTTASTAVLCFCDKFILFWCKKIVATSLCNNTIDSYLQQLYPPKSKEFLKIAPPAAGRFAPPMKLSYLELSSFLALNSKIMAKKQAHKEAALSFLHMVVAGKIREAYDQYVSPNFRHHNPYFKGDRESLLVAMEEAHTQFPNKIFKTYRTFEDRDLVAVHSSVQLKPDRAPIAVVHMFRFENGLIVEEWEVGQEVPEKSPNENGMF